MALNRPIDLATAEAIASTRIDAVMAPGRRRAARAVLARKASMRVVTADFAGVEGRGHRPPIDSGRDAGAGTRSGGRGSNRLGAGAQAALPEGFRVATKRHPTAERMAGAALRVAHLRAREVEHRHLHRRAADARGRRRPDEPGGRRERGRHEGARTRSVRCPARWRRRTRSFRSATVSTPSRPPARPAVVQPGGSVKDAEVIAAADEHGLAMVFTGTRHFRH